MLLLGYQSSHLRVIYEFFVKKGEAYPNNSMQDDQDHAKTILDHKSWQILSCQSIYISELTFSVYV